MPSMMQNLRVQSRAKKTATIFALCGAASVMGAGVAQAETQDETQNAIWTTTPNPSPAGAEAPKTMPVFANCAEVNKVFPYGVGMTAIQEDNASGQPSTNFYPDSAVYSELSKQGHDRDLDGIACEKPGGDAKSINFYADRLKGVRKATTTDPLAGNESTSDTAANPYSDCATAEKNHLGPIDKSNPWYNEKLDPNHNGIACEANTVWHGDKAYVLKSSVSHPGKTAFTYLGHDYVERPATGPKVNTDRVVTSSHDDVSKAIGASAFALAGGGFVLRRRMSSKA